MGYCSPLATGATNVRSLASCREEQILVDVVGKRSACSEWRRARARSCVREVAVQDNGSLVLTKGNNDKMDRHAECRFEAAYTAFETRRLDEAKNEKGLRRQQKID